MSDQIIIGREAFSDQKKRMIEEFGLEEEEAKEYFDNVKTHVMLQAQEMDKDWNDETVEAVTNLVFAIQQQQHQMNHQAKSRFYSRLFTFLTSTLQAALFSFGVWLLLGGNYLTGGLLLCLGAASVWAASMQE